MSAFHEVLPDQRGRSSGVGRRIAAGAVIPRATSQPLPTSAVTTPHPISSGRVGGGRPASGRAAVPQGDHLLLRAATHSPFLAMPGGPWVSGVAGRAQDQMVFVSPHEAVDIRARPVIGKQGVWITPFRGKKCQLLLWMVAPAAAAASSFVAQSAFGADIAPIAPDELGCPCASAARLRSWRLVHHRAQAPRRPRGVPTAPNLVAAREDLTMRQGRLVDGGGPRRSSAHVDGARVHHSTPAPRRGRPGPDRPKLAIAGCGRVPAERRPSREPARSSEPPRAGRPAGEGPDRGRRSAGQPPGPRAVVERYSSTAPSRCTDAAAPARSASSNRVAVMPAATSSSSCDRAAPHRRWVRP